jgi:ferredoxin
MTCKAKCPVKAISYNSHSEETFQNTDLTKRNFLIGVACTATAFGIGAIFSRFVKTTKPSVPVVVPPGAGSRERFASKCMECLLCITNCPGHVLTFGGESNTVHLNFQKGFCEYNCNTCSKICPTGAIDKISLEEKKLCRIGLAELELSHCVTITDKTECGACAEQCPTGAVQMKPGQNGVRIPYFASRDICIGCGACQNACPVRPKTAIWVNSIPLQLKAENPTEFFNKQKTHKSDHSNSDAWSF